MSVDQHRIKTIERRFRSLFGECPEIWTRAPGRVDLMGSHTDYNEGFVLTMAIDRDTVVAACPREDSVVRVGSMNMAGVAEFGLGDIARDEKLRWTNYVRGVVDAFQREGFSTVGYDALIHSTIPIGSGLGSSASLETAIAALLQALGRREFDPLKMALLCQRAENEFVGVNCGILDQYTAIYGQKGKALLLDCRHLSSRHIALPTGIRVVICNTHASRELGESEYGERRAACDGAARLLSERDPTVRTLRDVEPTRFHELATGMPPIVSKRARFIIEENHRVLALTDALRVSDTEAVRVLSLASFEGARDLYEIVSPEMETMEEAMVSAPGVIGARQAGAGFGGSMVAFVHADMVAAFAEHTIAAYHEVRGIIPDVFAVKPSDGAGLLTLESVRQCPACGGLPLS